jgi:hypothetical protein
MIAAAKFEGKTLVLTFKGGNASAGLSEVEEVIIEAADGELQERITRRFVGNFVRALPWQDSLQKVNAMALKYTYPGSHILTPRFPHTKLQTIFDRDSPNVNLLRFLNCSSPPRAVGRYECRRCIR